MGKTTIDFEVTEAIRQMDVNGAELITYGK
jgi:hypothetical protein